MRKLSKRKYETFPSSPLLLQPAGNFVNVVVKGLVSHQKSEYKFLYQVEESRYWFWIDRRSKSGPYNVFWIERYCVRISQLTNSLQHIAFKYIQEHKISILFTEYPHCFSSFVLLQGDNGKIHILLYVILIGNVLFITIISVI